MHEPRIIDLIYYAHIYLSELERSSRDYGTGEDLYPTDIHTVTAIAQNPGINLTQLADTMNVSKAAISKFVAKMVKAGYIEKKQALGNQKEVLFFPSDKGKLAAKGHSRYEKKTFGPLSRLEENLSDADRAVVVSYLQSLKNLTLKQGS